ncbi:MAG: histidine phosphatase family protein [Myxococcota bacterium]
MEVWLVRHAENLAAAEGRFGDGGLSPRGREQARRLGEALGGRSLRACFCSPLRRARETAEIALQGRSVEIRIWPELAEGSVGDLEGLSYREGIARHPKDFRLGRSLVPRLAASGRTAPGGESRDAFVARAVRAAERIREQLASAPSGLAWVVSHGGILNYLLQQLLDRPVQDRVPFGFDHCGVVRVISYRESPAFGPAPMLRFAPLGEPVDT